MSYGLISDKVSYPGDQRYNLGIYYKLNVIGRNHAIPLTHNGLNVFHCVYDSKDLYKQSTGRFQHDSDHKFYGSKINMVIAATTYFDDILRNYLSDPNNFDNQRFFNKAYTENVFYNNDTYGLSFNDEGNGHYRTYTTRNRPLKIIDHFWIGYYGADFPIFNYKFNYARKIGVVLPSFHYPDINDWHVNDKDFLYTVSGNEFRASHRGNTPGITQVNRKFELYDDCIANNRFSISDVLVVDLSDLPI